MGHPDSSEGATTVSSQGSLLLNIAAELRNRIYRLVLMADGPVCIEDDDISSRCALLHTCRQIKTEATSIFYRENKFCILLDGMPKTTQAAVVWLGSLDGTTQVIDKGSVRIALAGTPNITTITPQYAILIGADLQGTKDGYQLAHALITAYRGQEAGLPCELDVSVQTPRSEEHRTMRRKAYYNAVMAQLKLYGVVDGYPVVQPSK